MLANRSPTTTSSDGSLAGDAERVLRANWREGVHRDGTPYAFTCPGTPRYRHQWHWDSCFHAIAWCRYEPRRAREELRTVLRGGRADGFLPHTVFWHDHARWRRTPLYATQHVRGSRHTTTIGPPLLPFAWERVAAASHDEPGFATEALHALEAHLDWLDRERDVDGDGLLSILLPDESGLDDSPKFDPVYGRCAHYRVGSFTLIARYGRLGWSAHAIAAAHDQHVEDVWVNVAYALSLRAMARMAGDPSYERRAERVEAALLERCLDPATGLFFDLAGRKERAVRVSTWSALSPLILDGLPEDVRRRLVEEHLLHPRRYRAPVGIPSVAIEEPSYTPGFDLWRTWRGPAWMNTAWLMLPALRDLGYGEEADRIARSLARAVQAHGLREYYDPRTGRGLATRGFGWSALVVDMADGPAPRTS
jgi:glycogen debranching enzyme